MENVLIISAILIALRLLILNIRTTLVELDVSDRIQILCFVAGICCMAGAIYWEAVIWFR